MVTTKENLDIRTGHVDKVEDSGFDLHVFDVHLNLEVELLLTISSECIIESECHHRVCSSDLVGPDGYFI